MEYSTTLISCSSVLCLGPEFTWLVVASFSRLSLTLIQTSLLSESDEEKQLQKPWQDELELDFYQKMEIHFLSIFCFLLIVEPLENCNTCRSSWKAYGRLDYIIEKIGLYYKLCSKAYIRAKLHEYRLYCTFRLLGKTRRGFMVVTVLNVLLSFYARQPAISKPYILLYNWCQ